jgi:hypothetical protein
MRWGWEKMHIIGNDSQLAILFGEAEDTACKENMGVRIERRKVGPTLTVLEIGSDGESLRGTS